MAPRRIVVQLVARVKQLVRRAVDQMRETLRRATRRSKPGDERRPVIVHWAAGQETAVRRALDRPRFEGGMATGLSDKERIAALEAAGPVVERTDEPRDAPLRRPPPAPPSATEIDVPPEAPPPRLLAPPPIRPVDIYVLALRGPLFPAWRAALARAGGELISHHGRLHFTVRIPLDRLAAVLSLDFVDSGRPYDVRETVDVALFAIRGAVTTDSRPRYEAIAHDEPGVGEITAWLRERGMGRAELVSGRVIRMEDPGPASLAELARHPEVACLYQHVEPVPFNDHARRLVGIDPPAGGGAGGPLQWTGKGQVAGVADSGLDLAHEDVKEMHRAGRLGPVIARGRPGDPSDPTGHGTHITGTVAGAGKSSNGAIRGMAPESRVVFQSIMDARRKFVTDPSVADLLQQAYDAGARVHCDSWGIEYNGSAYPSQSLQVDEFVVAHPDMLVVTAAGNDGTAANPRHSPPGSVDLMSLAAPGTAKNALTVGASCSDRAPVGAPPPTWNAWWPTRFPRPGIGDEPVSGDPERMAALSGRGPFEDQGRVKPDVVAPGTFILSTRAAGADARVWADGPSPEYAFDGGTSMATAVVAGCALLLRQFLDEAYDHRPSAALLKAILVNGARWLGGPDAQAPPPGRPNFHQGFGVVSLPDSIPTTEPPAMGFAFADAWADRSMEIPRTGCGWKWTLHAAGETPLRLALAWTDPGDARGVVQNNLGLRVRHLATGASWIGNAHRPQFLASPADLANNVQAVRIDAPPDGEYTVWVEAKNLTQPGQRFALVATGAPGLALDGGTAYS
jgi:serine protease AprX